MKKHSLIPLAAFFALVITPFLNANPGSDPFSGFVGQWENIDPDTGGVTRVEIIQENEKFKVRAWGRCHPTECVWGETDGQSITDDQPFLHVLWIHSFKEESHKVTLLPGGKLQIDTAAHFTDESGRKDREFIYSFRKGWARDWSDAKE